MSLYCSFFVKDRPGKEMREGMFVFDCQGFTAAQVTHQPSKLNYLFADGRNSLTDRVMFCSNQICIETDSVVQRRCGKSPRRNSNY